MEDDSIGCHKKFIIQNNCGKYLVRQNREEADLILSPSGLNIMERKSNNIVYEFLRIKNGKRLFWDEHIRHLQIKCEKADLLFPEEDELEDMYHSLVKAQDKLNALVKIAVTKDEVYMYYVQDIFTVKDKKIGAYLLRWPKDDYWHKNRQHILQQAGQEARKHKLELLLLDEEDSIYKSTLANVYFILDGKIITAASDDCVNGITRKCIFEAASKLDLDIIEDYINIEDISAGKEKFAFLSSSLSDFISIETINIRIIEEKDLLSWYEDDSMSRNFDLLADQNMNNLLTMDKNNEIFERLKKQYIYLLEDFEEEN